jgi:hypothetical protein
MTRAKLYGGAADGMEIELDRHRYVIEVVVPGSEALLSHLNHETFIHHLLARNDPHPCLRNAFMAAQWDVWLHSDLAPTAHFVDRASDRAPDRFAVRRVIPRSWS